MFSREFVRFFFFFFQAEDGIRDVAVTGVQTCALPISGARSAARPAAWVRDFRAPRSPKGVRSVPGGSPGAQCGRGRHTDRKSTRLNSSHGYISYAVFCLKKKKKKTIEKTKHENVFDGA